MTITTTLIGKIGGQPEVMTVRVNARTQDVTVTVPDGWDNGIAIFYGNRTGTDPVAFSRSYRGMVSQTLYSGEQAVTGKTFNFSQVNGVVNMVKLA